MSCEDDDYGWEEEPEPIVEVRKINLEVNTVSKEELSTIKDAMKLCLDRKLEKLRLLLRQMNVFKVDDYLLVNDRYNTALDFEKTVQAFGMDIKQVSIPGFKGKTYVLGDKITKLLGVVNSQYDYASLLDIKEMPASIDISKIPLFKYADVDKTYAADLRTLLTEIQKNGYVKVEGSETLIDGVSQGIISNKETVVNKLQAFLQEIKTQACKNNKNVQYGTTEILYSRARQMGYSVQKEQKGTEIQLVLMRVE